MYQKINRLAKCCEEGRKEEEESGIIIMIVDFNICMHIGVSVAVKDSKEESTLTEGRI